MGGKGKYVRARFVSRISYIQIFWVTRETYAMYDSCLGLGILHPSFGGFRLSYRAREPTQKYTFGFRQSYGMARLPSKKNGTVPCPKPKNLYVEQLTINTNSNVSNRATNLAFN